MKHSEKLKLLERRRFRGARLLAARGTQAKVARRVGVSRQTIMRWDRVRVEGGLESLRRPKKFGRPERLSETQRAELVQILKAAGLASGFGTELWTIPRIRQLIGERFGVAMVSTSVWRLFGRLGWSVQRPTDQARECDERAIRAGKQKRWPELKK